MGTQQNITIASKEEKLINNKIVITIKGSDGKSYSHWVDPQNNGWENRLNVGGTVFAYIVEKPNPRNVQYPFRNIYPAKEKPSTASVIAQTGMKQEADQKEDEKWDRISWGKCKTLFLVEAYKMNRDLTVAERDAEEWANACMRKISDKKPVYKQYPETLDGFEDLPPARHSYNEPPF